jgi:hypothetical protein
MGITRCKGPSGRRVLQQRSLIHSGAPPQLGLVAHHPMPTRAQGGTAGPRPPHPKRGKCKQQEACPQGYRWGCSVRVGAALSHARALPPIAESVRQP